jgi:hypothetical protein
MPRKKVAKVVPEYQFKHGQRVHNRVTNRDGVLVVTLDEPTAGWLVRLDSGMSADWYESDLDLVRLP